MKKTIEIEIEVTPEETASILEQYDAGEFARMLNALGARMKEWGVAKACMQLDHVGMSPTLNDAGRFAATMIAKASEIVESGEQA